MTDALAIVALRNAAPALLATNERQRAALQNARNALDRHGRHDVDRAALRANDEQCDCGLAIEIHRADAALTAMSHE